MHFVDVSETNGPEKENSRSDHVTLNASAVLNNEA